MTLLTELREAGSEPPEQEPSSSECREATVLTEGTAKGMRGYFKRSDPGW